MKSRYFQQQKLQNDLVPNVTYNLNSMIQFFSFKQRLINWEQTLNKCMTSLKHNFDQSCSNQAQNVKYQKVERKAYLNLSEQNNIHHSSLISQINLKNDALAKHSQKTTSMSSHPNYLTFCQRYADVLCQKYDNTQCQNNDNSHNKQKSRINQENNPLNQQKDEQTIMKSIVYLRRYFQNCQLEYQRNYEQCSLQIKQIRTVIETKLRPLSKQNESNQNDLLILDIVTSKMNKKMNKQQITPFTLFVDEIKNKTPSRVKNEQPQQLNANQRPNTQNIAHKPHRSPSPEPRFQTVQTKHMFTSNIITPKSPDLLSGYQDRQKENSILLVSFKPNLSNSQNGCQTLKYSESSLNLNLDKNLAKPHQSYEKEDEVLEPPFSPVQPYRLEKLMADKKEHLKNDQDSFIQLQQLNIFKSQEDEANPILKQVQRQVMSKTSPMIKKYQALTATLFESAQTIGMSLQNLHQSINTEKRNLNEEWNDILQLLGKDIQNLQGILILEKNQCDMKDQKFLQNLQTLQNELIEDIFLEKEARKTQESVLTQVLSRIVQSLEQNNQ